MKVFISYSWDNEEHKNWVRMLADTLIENGIHVILDQYDLPIGADRFKFMEKSIRDADCILCICTPNYVKRANLREKGVGEETRIITPHFFDKHQNKEFIPIIRKTESDLSPTPDYMAALIFVDFRDDSAFTLRMEDLLRHLHKQPRHLRPSLGKIPDFQKPGSIPSKKKDLSATELYDQFKSILHAGLNDPMFLLNYGRLCFSLEKDDDARFAFNRILEIDPEYTSFSELDSKVRTLAKRKESFHMNLNSRKALVYLGVINNDEDYVLNGAYDTEDTEVLVLAGKYYLSIYDADIPTAIAYFIKATKGESVDSIWVRESDSAIYSILNEKKVWYPKMSWDFIKECVAKWNEHKLGLM